MLTENNNLRKLLNVDVWHAAGYTGKGVNVGSFETFGDTNLHGYGTRFACTEMSPDANVISIAGQPDPYNFILNNNICAVFRSIEMDTIPPENLKFPIDILDHCLLLTAAGNSGTKVEGTLMVLPEWFGVGAVSTLDLTKTFYSNMSDHLLCSAPGTIYIKYAGGGTNPDQGTSFAAPIVVGLCALVQQLVISKRGFGFSGYELSQFIKDNSRDIAPVGFDDKTGYGVFILPNPQDVDVYKYITVVDMFIDKNTYVVDNKPQYMDVAPRIINDRTFTPARYVAEALGAKVEWDGTLRMVRMVIKK